jgi:hypothetical protein
MAITEKDRKILWGKSGNRCAICRCELVMGGLQDDGGAVVGDECHIVAKSSAGPRGNPDIKKSQLDKYNNLILLCKIHHKAIDDQPSLFTEAHLRQIKERHEEWVKASLHEASLPNANQELHESDEDIFLDIAEFIMKLTDADRRSGKYDEKIRRVLSELDTRHRVILEYRLGLFGHRKHSYSEIGEKFGIPPYRIKTYERQAVRKLKEF